MPSLGWWQVAHERPLVPRLLKNGPVRSMPPPVVLYVSDAPLGLEKNVPLGINVNCCPLTPAIASNPAAATKAPAKRFRLDRCWIGSFLPKNEDKKRTTRY